jgi:3-oxoadipate enol-lactonase
VKLPHDEVGDGKPLVLLHAGVADRTMWRERPEPLADAGYRVVALDLPEFGEAPPPETESAPWIDLLETMDALAIDRAALVGNSFGGAVAMRVALVPPDRVTAVALISAPPPDLDAPSPALPSRLGRPRTRRSSAATSTRPCRPWSTDGRCPMLRPNSAIAWRPCSGARSSRRRARLRSPRRQIRSTQAPDPLDPGARSARPRRQIRSTQAPDPLDAEPGRLADIDVPALVVAGEHDLADFREGARRMARQLPNARHAEINGAGHLAPLETRAAFRELLRGFLEGVAG